MVAYYEVVNFSVSVSPFHDACIPACSPDNTRNTEMICLTMWLYTKMQPHDVAQIQFFPGFGSETCQFILNHIANVSYINFTILDKYWYYIGLYLTIITYDGSHDHYIYGAPQLWANTYSGIIPELCSYSPGNFSDGTNMDGETQLWIVGPWKCFTIILDPTVGFKYTLEFHNLHTIKYKYIKLSNSPYGPRII